MNRIELIQLQLKKLSRRHKQLLERAYNYKQTDSALSDFFEFRAIKLLNKMNRLKYLSRDLHQEQPMA
ncbi:hypothetical protein PK35_02140 [Tamlana nanhaiensis]|uniref:Lacal_2735 family protein n=1 Tax=Neotamlana nanhaiensis TaxID=1382798 RepID=A0A0D7W7B6_9FLAO|nr:Lacal_2735 family protein [Tamlana nanhaiensis]KJD34603.1 hypothetical protein PK35_02140 [Tamlana nanhaiensis]